MTHDNFDRKRRFCSIKVRAIFILYGNLPTRKHEIVLQPLKSTFPMKPAQKDVFYPFSPSKSEQFKKKHKNKSDAAGPKKHVFEKPPKKHPILAPFFMYGLVPFSV